MQGIHWLNQGYRSHHLFKDGNWCASLKMKGWTTYQGADVLIEEESYTFEQIGHLKRHLEIRDSYGALIAEVTQPKWFSSKLELYYKERTYTIDHKNLPLVEYRLSQGDVPLLRYGLEYDGGMLNTYRRASRHEIPSLLEAILWFLFPAKTSYTQGWSESWQHSM